MDNEETSVSTGYSLGAPRQARRALCLAYGGRVPPALSRSLAPEVYVDIEDAGRVGSVDIALLIGHPALDARNGKNSLDDYLKTLGRVWRLLGPSGRLIVAFAPSASAGVLGTHAWLTPVTWKTVRQIAGAIAALAPSKQERLHVLPHVWRPTFFYTAEAPDALKQLALSQLGGWRARTAVRMWLWGGRFCPARLVPTGIVWIASR